MYIRKAGQTNAFRIARIDGQKPTVIERLYTKAPMKPRQYIPPPEEQFLKFFIVGQHFSIFVLDFLAFFFVAFLFAIVFNFS